jgi:hypothetical protein
MLFLEPGSSDVNANGDQEKKCEIISGNAGGIHTNGWPRGGVEVQIYTRLTLAL